MKLFTPLKWVAVLILSVDLSLGQPIPENFYGIGYWMPPAIGTTSYGGGVGTQFVNDKIKDGKIKIVRFGGNAYDTDGGNFFYTIPDYIAACQNIKNAGAEPLVQIPVKYNNFSVTANQVKQFVYDLNVTYQLKIRYFSFGNEYDRYPAPKNSPAFAANTIKAFSHAAKTAYPNAKNEILIVAPSLSWFGAKENTADQNTLLEKLVGGIPNRDFDITGQNNAITGGKYYYADIISWNDYPINNSDLNSGNYTSRRNESINYPGGTSIYKFASNILTMNGWISAANTIHGRTGANALKFSVTEMNINVYNPPYAGTGDDTDPLKNSVYGIGCASFFAGQFWADMYSQMLKNGWDNVNKRQNAAFLIPWSIYENNGQRGSEDHGYLDDDYTSGIKERSTYWHTWFLTNFFKGTYIIPKTFNLPTNVKVIGAKSCINGNSFKVVMIMNQNSGNNTKTFKINMNTLATTFNPTNLSLTDWYDAIPGETTMLFIFDDCAHILKKYTYDVTKNYNNLSPAPQVFNKVKCNKYNPCLAKKCSNPNPPPQYSGVMNNSTTISDSAWISGTLTVQNNKTLTIDKAEVIFSEQTKIQVQPGGKLIIRDSYLHGCEDGKMWDGIDVKNGNNNMAGQLIMERNTITDAIVAVKTEKTNKIFVSENNFSNGTTAIEMEKNKGFTIQKNQFSNFEHGIKSKNTMVDTSLIKENYFSEVKYALYYENDNHSKLEISCNIFENYSEHAIKSMNTTLKDQGSVTEGAGNEYISASTQLNDKLSHQGNAMKYYYDPSMPVTNGMNVQILPSQTDGCSSQRLGQFEESQNEENYNTEEYSSALLNSSNGGNHPELIGNIPNPAAEKTAVYFRLGKQSASGEILITNVYGEKVALYKINGNMDMVEVDCSKLAGGIYFTALFVEGNAVGVKKMITMH